MISADKRAERKILAVRRAERRLHNRVKDIDWEIDELVPEIKALRERTRLLEVPSEQIVEIEFVKKGKLRAAHKSH